MRDYDFISDISNELLTEYKQNNIDNLIDKLIVKIENILETVNTDDSSESDDLMDLSLNEDINTVKIILRKKISNNINNPPLDKTTKAQDNQNMNQYLYIYFYIMIKTILSIIIILFLLYYTKYYKILFNDVNTVTNTINGKFKKVINN